MTVPSRIFLGESFFFLLVFTALLGYYLQRESFQKKLHQKGMEQTELELQLALRTQALERQSESRAYWEAQTHEWEAKARDFEERWRQSQQEAEQAKQGWAWQREQDHQVQTTLQKSLEHFLEQRQQKEQAWQSLQMSQLLGPLKHQLEGFQSAMETYFKHESQERYLLAHELQKLQNLNAQLSSNATQLSEALRGDSKLQGSWGEMLLEKILEQSGLREGQEYRTQVSLPSHEEGRRLQPDVLIYLPKGRMVMVDAKVSLTAYTRYHAADTAEERGVHLQAHLHSIRTHIKQLSRKGYTHLPGLETLDYILLFMPIEPAFSVALQHCPSLLQEAQEHCVMLVTPATLMLSLKTIEFLWKNEHRSQQAQLLSKRIALLFSKFQRFVKGCESLGQALKRAQLEYEQAMGRLHLGPGNLLKQLQSFQSLSDEASGAEGSAMDPTLPEAEVLESSEASDAKAFETSNLAEALTSQEGDVIE